MVSRPKCAQGKRRLSPESSKREYLVVGATLIVRGACSASFTAQVAVDRFRVPFNNWKRVAT